MDLSKLPRLSGEQKQDDPPAAAPVPEPDQADHDDAPAISGGEVWLSAIVGVVLMMLGRGFAQWAIAKTFGLPYDSGYVYRDNRPVDYWDVQGFLALSESGTFLFGLAMVLEAGVMLFAILRPANWRGAVLCAMAITAVATVYNLVPIFVLLANSMTPIVSLVAVGFGGYALISQWGLLRGRRG